MTHHQVRIVKMQCRAGPSVVDPMQALGLRQVACTLYKPTSKQRFQSSVVIMTVLASFLASQSLAGTAARAVHKDV